MLSFKQQLVQMDGEREQVTGGMADGGLPIRVQQLGRRELGSADGAEEALPGVGIGDLHRVAVQQGDPSLSGHAHVGLVEIADHGALLVQHVSGLSQVRCGAHKVTPGETLHPRGCPDGCPPIGRVGDPVQADGIVHVHHGHQVAGESPVFVTTSDGQVSITCPLCTSRHCAGTCVTITCSRRGRPGSLSSAVRRYFLKTCPGGVTTAYTSPWPPAASFRTVTTVVPAPW